MRLLTAVLLLAPAVGARQEGDALAPRLREIEAASGGVLGAAALHLGSGRLIGWRAKERFPMLELTQLAVAVDALALTESGELPFHMMVRLEPADFAPGYSPVRDTHPEGAVATIGQLLEWAVRDNDSSASDKLLRLSGGPEAVQKRLDRLFRGEIRVDRSLAQMALAFRYAADPTRFSTDEKDSATPAAMTLLLSAIDGKRLLHPLSHERLIGWMRSTPHGGNRLASLLGPMLLYHKAGSTSRWDQAGVCSSDAGVADLPDRRGRVAIAVFVKLSTKDVAAREHAIAEAALLLYRWFAAAPER